VDQRILEIRPVKDKFGRAGKWDFSTAYTYAVARAYPLEGDLGIDFSSGNSIQILPLLASVSAESVRSTHVSADIFDPQGKLILHFAEPINKDGLQISGRKILAKEYGEKCKLDPRAMKFGPVPRASKNPTPRS